MLLYHYIYKELINLENLPEMPKKQLYQFSLLYYKKIFHGDYSVVSVCLMRVCYQVQELLLSPRHITKFTQVQENNGHKWLTCSGHTWALAIPGRDHFRQYFYEKIWSVQWPSTVKIC